METIPLNPVRSRSKLDCCLPNENDGLRVIFFCFGILCLCVTIALIISIYLGEPEVVPRGAVATDSQTCSQAGVDVLIRGGNAVDAAISSILCMCIVHPHITSIGGGGIMIIQNHLRMKTPSIVNFQETAPAFFNVVGGGDERGANTVGIPGLLKGLWEAHKKFGKYNWAELLEPAIRLCENGFPVSSQLSDAVNQLPDDSPLRQSTLFFPLSFALAEGQIIRQPNMASFLKSIAKNGVEDFYNGKFGEKLVNLMKSQGQGWSMNDLQGYKVNFEEAIKSTFQNMTIFTSNAPTSGPQLLSMLNILDGLDSVSRTQLNVTLAHKLMEVMRWTQTQVAHLGDPSFNEGVRLIVKDMLNRTLANEVRKQIRIDFPLPEDKLVPTVPPPQASVVSVMDNDDLYVSVVSGLNSAFGSHLLTPDGYLLNNAMSNFYANLSLANAHVKAGQRPLQFALPVIAMETNNRCGLRIATGSSDAALLGQVLYNMIRFNQTVTDVIRIARIQSEAQSLQVEMEDTQANQFPADFKVALVKNEAHKIKVRKLAFPSINIVSKTGDTLASQSDNRGGGFAVKYGP